MNAIQPTIQEIRATPSLDALYGTLETLQMTPGWVPRKVPMMTREPTTQIGPRHWRYDRVKAALDAAGDLISTELAERRNLVLFNALSREASATAHTLVGAYQMIMPGETARTHRHAAHALRVIIDAKGSFSVVDGEKTPMESGDIVLTPGSCWHGHGHDGDEPAYWFDGLDVPLAWLLEQVSFEEYPGGVAPIDRVVQESPYRFSWDSTQRALETAKADPEGFFSVRVQLDAPSMPTIGLFVQKLETGQATRAYRSSDHKVFLVMRGTGSTRAGEMAFDWGPGDAFVVPVWHDFSLKASSDAVLFMMSDEPLMRYARFWRMRAAE